MQKTIIVMPAYNAAMTLSKTLAGLPKVYDRVILCDDASKDDTYVISKNLGILTLLHSTNRGYGANQKSLYKEAFKYNPSIIIMVHPDNQYNTDCITEIISLIEQNKADLVLGNRMKTALKNKMPLWKYVSNRFLSAIQNRIYGTHLSEFHSGLRAYKADVLKEINYNEFSDDFVFDSEMITAFVAHKSKISEVATECFYNDQVSSINLRRSLIYGLGTMRVALKYLFKKS